MLVFRFVGNSSRESYFLTLSPYPQTKIVWVLAIAKPTPGMGFRVVTHFGFGCFQVNQLITVAAVIYTDFLLAGTVPGIPIPTAITDAYNALLLDRPVCSSKKK